MERDEGPVEEFCKTALLFEVEPIKREAMQKKASGASTAAVLFSARSFYSCAAISHT